MELFTNPFVYTDKRMEVVEEEFKYDEKNKSKKNYYRDGFVIVGVSRKLACIG